MTAEAVARGFAVGLTRDMAARTRHADMRTLQRVVSMVVIELLAAELHDVGVAPEVLGVAGTTLGGVDTRQSAVEAAMLPDIGRDLLVTVEAQAGLATAIGAVVA